MKTAVTGLLVGVGLMWVVAYGTTPGSRAWGGLPESGSTADLISWATPLGDHRQQLTVIDPKSRVVGVYQVDGASGEISLKSVRNIHWDLQMSEFNAASPLPQEIRSLVEQR